MLTACTRKARRASSKVAAKDGRQQTEQGLGTILEACQATRGRLGCSRISLQRLSVPPRRPPESGIYQTSDNKGRYQLSLSVEIQNPRSTATNSQSKQPKLARLNLQITKVFLRLEEDFLNVLLRIPTALSRTLNRQPSKSLWTFGNTTKARELFGKSLSLLYWEQESGSPAPYQKNILCCNHPVGNWSLF